MLENSEAIIAYQNSFLLSPEGWQNCGGQLPYLGYSALYVCTSNLCSQPVAYAEPLDKQHEGFLGRLNALSL